MKSNDKDFYKGIRVTNGSIKAYKMNNGQYQVVISKYFWGVKYSIKRIVVDSIEDVEDYFVHAKFEKRI